MIKNYKLPLRPIERTSSERVSVFTSRKGSITVEAAIAVPIFFLAVVCLLYLMEMMAVQTAVRSGLQYAGKRAAQEYAIKPFMQTKQLEKEVVEGIGADRLERSIVEGGSAGIDCSHSQTGGIQDSCSNSDVFHPYDNMWCGIKDQGVDWL